MLRPSITHLPMDIATERVPEVVRRESDGTLIMRCQWQHCRAEFVAQRDKAKWCPQHRTPKWKKREQQRVASLTVERVQVATGTHSPRTRAAPGGLRQVSELLAADGLFDLETGEHPSIVGPDGRWSSDHGWDERWHPDYMPPELPKMSGARLVNYQLATLEPGERVIGDPGPRTDPWGVWCESLRETIWGNG